MEVITTRGIVARRADYGESNAMLTVISRELGVISVCAYGVRSGKSKMTAASQVLCLGDFVLTKKNSDFYRAESVEIVESFYPICEDFEKLALSGYFLELARDVCSAVDGSVLSLLLNSLYVLAYKDIDMELARAVFEFKLAQLSGYEPQLEACMNCGNDAGMYFDFQGGLVCPACKNGNCAVLLPGTLSAMRYILASDEKKLFSFQVSEEVKAQLASVCEKYLADKMEKSYKSLEYYKKIRRM